MRTPSDQAAVLQTFASALSALLPWGPLQVDTPGFADGALAVTARLRLATPRGDVTLRLEMHRDLAPGNAAAAAERAARSAHEDGAAGALVVTDWLSPGTRRELTRSGVSWGDATGNVRLQLDDPPILVVTPGEDRSPRPTRRVIRRLGGRRAAEIVRGLAELEPPFTLSDLVDTIGSIDPTHVSRVLRGLAEDSIVCRRPRGPVKHVDLVGLVERWVEDYRVLEHNVVHRYLRLGDPLDLVDAIAALDPATTRDLGLVLTGALVGYQAAPRSEPTVAMAYATDVQGAAEALRLIPAGEGGNVLLLTPGNPVVLERPWTLGGIRLVPPTTAAADILSMEDPDADAAFALLDWARAHPDAWRRPR